MGPPQKHLFKWVQGALTPALKRPDLKVDDSPISTAEVTNERSYTSTPPYVFITFRGMTCKKKKAEFGGWSISMSFVNCAHHVVLSEKCSGD